MRPKEKVKCIWSPRLSYAIGLLATDGSLSVDGRHIDFTSKDLNLVEIFRSYLGLTNRITKKARAQERVKKYFHIQFGDVKFYQFLVNLGLTPAKSKTIGRLKIQDKYFFDFLRGCIDGDGSISIFQHPESQYPQLRVRICSAGKKFLQWIQSKTRLNNINGFLYPATRSYVLAYGKASSISLLNRIYYKNCPVSLERKLLIAKPFLRM